MSQDAESQQQDLREILQALGLFDGAMPLSPHEVVQQLVLPKIAELTASLADIDRLKRQARDISLLLSDAGCNSMPIPEGVRWLILKAEKLEHALKEASEN